MRKRTKGSGERIGGEPSRQKGWTWPQCEEDCEWEMTRRSMNNGSLPGDGDGGEEKGSGRRFLPGRLGGAVRSFVRSFCVSFATAVFADRVWDVPDGYILAESHPSL